MITSEVAALLTIVHEHFGFIRQETLTIRQQYKVAALQGYMVKGLSQEILKVLPPTPEGVEMLYARMAGAMADAMIKEDEEHEVANS